MLSVLPEDLLTEISTYIEENHKILFAFINKSLSNQLLRRARKIFIDSEYRLNEFFFSQSFHERIKRVIHHPYYQLNICIPPDFLLSFESKEVLQGLSCNELLTCLEFFISSQPLPFLGIRKLSMIKEKIVQVDDTFVTAMERIIKANLGLEEMSLTNMDFTDLPALTGLKSLTVSGTSLLTSSGLHISDYKSLQSLTLQDCSGIIDVACLDGIPNLKLVECGGIRDITKLHQNHSIEIINCRMIDDYSKSFKYSKSISIDCSNSIFLVNLNFHHLTHVERLTIKIDRLIHAVSEISFPCCDCFHTLEIEGFRVPFTLPEKNPIKELIVRKCPKFQLQNISHIKSVHLELMNSTSLEGLGPGNRTVELIKFSNVVDFTPLKDCEKVSLLSCRGFTDARQLGGVKELIVKPFAVDDLPNLEGVNHLILSSFPDNIIEIPPTVKILSFDNLLEDKVYEIPAFISTYPSIEKIIISLLEEVNTRRVKNTLHEQLTDSKFLVDMLPGSPPRIVLLRKMDENNK